MEKNKEYVDNEELEIDLVLDALLKKSDFDYRNYSRAHIKRRLSHRLAVSGFSRFSELIPELIYNPDFVRQLLLDLSINVTEMFRDPEFYVAFKALVCPYLKTYPFLKLWHAGCSSGQEVYSTSILLKEGNLYDNSQIYATDFNVDILERAKEARYPIENIKNYTKNYHEAGGEFSFSDYYSADSDSAILSVIFCRNVLIYFDKTLQNKVLQLFHDSLVPGGFLCLGSKESILYSDVDHLFEVVSRDWKIYRKKVH
ncbi:MAG: chemotaxis protein CheR [Spirochaetaceae bacterium 4572_7]|nr:MAG: chemotaxis protein CheR [Spirochaetaceae bacterium 4572_7]